MVQTLGVALILLWVLMFASGYTFGNYIHVLLLAGVVILLVEFIKYKSAAPASHNPPSIRGY